MVHYSFPFVNFKRVIETQGESVMTTQAEGIKIHQANQSWFDKKLAKVNNKAKKLGFDPIEYQVMGVLREPRLDKKGNKTGIEDVFNNIFITKTPVLRVEGWEVIASVDHMKEGNFIKKFPTSPIEVPPQYRHTGKVCQHCEKKRRRKTSYVLLHENGETKQVGSTCLADFLGGHHYDYYAKMALLISNIKSYFAGQPCYQGWAWGFDPLHFLERVATKIRHYGWVSKGKAYQEGIRSTMERVIDGYYEASREPSEEVLPQDKALAKETLAWAKEIPSNNSEDYLFKLKLVCSEMSIERDKLGMLASAVQAYQRFLRQQKPKQSNSSYVGQVGERIQVIGTLTLMKLTEGYYGFSTLLKFETPSGDKLSWFASGNKMDRWVEGNTYEIVGRVKAHKEFRGVKETQLTRCRVS